MPQTSSTVSDSIEREIRSIVDPRARAMRAVEAHRSARDHAARMMNLRRDALVSLHESGLTWQEVADEVGMSLKAVTKAAAGPVSTAEAWWKRIPDEEAGRHKRGPGGIPIDLVIRKSDLMTAAVEVMEEYRTQSQPEDDGAMRPAELRAGVMDKIGRTVAMPSLRAAILTLVRDGVLEKVGVGRYALVGGKSGQRRQRVARS